MVRSSVFAGAGRVLIVAVALAAAGCERFAETGAPAASAPPDAAEPVENGAISLDPVRFQGR